MSTADTQPEKPMDDQPTRTPIARRSSGLKLHSRFSTGALLRLLNRAACDSAEHRAIRDELRRRELAKIKPNGVEALLFTGAEWSKAIKE
jgi:hypothetical protein